MIIEIKQNVFLCWLSLDFKEHTFFLRDFHAPRHCLLV